jgi:hypothetical protein
LSECAGRARLSLRARETEISRQPSRISHWFPASLRSDKKESAIDATTGLTPVRRHHWLMAILDD